MLNGQLGIGTEKLIILADAVAFKLTFQDQIGAVNRNSSFMTARCRTLLKFVKNIVVLKEFVEYNA